MRFVLVLAVAGLMQAEEITPANTKVEAVVEKTGLLSGKRHVLAWPEFRGTFSISPPKVELTVDAAQVRVLDDWINEGKREDVRKEAVGKDVLHAARFPQIRFVSTGVTGDISGAFQIAGELTIRGITKAVTMTVHKSGDRYEGETRFPMSQFGIKPPKAALGAIGTKDEMTIRFQR